jgi:hypothetical protein
VGSIFGWIFLRIVRGAGSGNTWTHAGKFVVAGKQYLFKDTFALAPDLMSAMAKAEISTDGNTWTPWFEGKYTKVKPVAKK